MRFLVDESTGPAVAEWLRENGHEVFSVFNEARGMQDVDIIQKAFTDNWILVTNDKDFGEKVYRERQPHRGVVLLRLEDERAFVKIEIMRRLLESYIVHRPSRAKGVTVVLAKPCTAWCSGRSGLPSVSYVPRDWPRFKSECFKLRPLCYPTSPKPHLR